MARFRAASKAPVEDQIYLVYCPNYSPLAYTVAKFEDGEFIESGGFEIPSKYIEGHMPLEDE